ncbi:hypothetical protein NQ318_017816 [Aromia moschata]|uniref:C2H2-type domain-containing protein n=1 Tax=Aromia moschata TaxID=1265417 RepID=A0AAV8YHV2_9CUCU|nr:hypothetical protein NQ318_017816 [Aromia moschata]
MGSKNNPSPSEWRVLKPSAIPSINLPEKSTFKIKISKKKNNDQEIKIEEVKLEDEEVKMPKKHVEVLPRPRTQSRRAASKEALKQMQLLLDDDDDDPVEIPSDDDVIPVEPSPPPPPKKKYKLSHRKSSDGYDRDVLVLKSITNRNAENTLELDCWVEQLEEVQKSRIEKLQEEEKQLQEKLDSLIKSANAEVIHKGDLNTIIEVTEQVQSALTASQGPSNLILNNSIGGTPQSYQLVMDPRLGLIVGAVTSQGATTPTNTPQKVYQGKVTVAQGLTQQTATPSTSQAPTRTGRPRRGIGAAKATPPSVAPALQTRSVIQTRSAPSKAAIPSKAATIVKPGPRVEGSSRTAGQERRGGEPAAALYEEQEGGLATDGAATAKKAVVDLTTEDGRAVPDSREISFNKLQGKTYPSLVVVARPHLRVLDLSVDRPKLDAQVKSVLMHAPTKFTEWLIQQGLVRSEQKCSVHTATQLKLGMYSDVSKFPYSGGYVWISECCPQRSSQCSAGSPHPPMVILKLLYHWACQTNIQNVTQWVKVDNLYVKGMFTWLRSVCTVALQTHVRQLGGPGIKVEVGVISLGTTSQDGNQRQVKVEVLGILESKSKLIRLQAVEPQVDGDRNYKKRFSKILEPIYQWVHPQSILVADLTVDKQTLHNMGFSHVLQSTSSEYGSNRQIMEYLRRIVPRMFQNTLSLLSRQIIQQFLDELVWREWFGTSSLQAFSNLVIHLSEQTALRQRAIFNRSWRRTLLRIGPYPVGNSTKVIENAPKKPRSRAKPEAQKVRRNVTVGRNRPPKSTSPDVPEQMVPLENYYYGTIDNYAKSTKIILNMKCPFCKSLFNNNIQLMNHLFKHAHNVSQDAQLCRYCLTTTSHPAETKFDNGFVCLICETQYMNPFVLGKHMSKEHCPSRCGTCGYRCSNHKQAIDHFYKQHDDGPTTVPLLPEIHDGVLVFQKHRSEHELLHTAPAEASAQAVCETLRQVQLVVRPRRTCLGITR